MSDSNANTPIKMWPVLDYADFVTVELHQDFADGSYRKESLPTFDGEGASTGNAEAFLYVRERFVSASNRKLQWGELEKFENFEDVLKGPAQHYWTDTVSTHANVVAAADADKFQVAMNLMMIRFCGGCSAGDADMNLHKIIMNGRTIFSIQEAAITVIVLEAEEEGGGRRSKREGGGWQQNRHRAGMGEATHPPQ